MRRITPEQVVAAYKKTGLHPTTGSWVTSVYGEDCGCAMGAVLGSRKFNLDRVGDTEDAARKLRVSLGYALGFTRGFDGVAMVYQLFPGVDRHEYEVGFVDGVDAHLAVIEAGLYVEVES